MSNHKELEVQPQLTEHGFIIDLLGGVTVELVDLESAGKSAIEYIQGVLASGESPTLIAVNKDDGDSLRNGIPSAPKPQTDEEKADVKKSIDSGTRITVTKDVPTGSIMIYRQPAAQSMSIMSELDQLLVDAGIDMPAAPSATQEVGEYLQSLEDTGFFKDDK